MTKTDFPTLLWRVVLLLTITLLGCSLLSRQEPNNPTPNIVPLDTPTPPPAQASTATLMNEFAEGHFITTYPAWPEDQNRPADSLLGVAQGPFGVWVNRYGVLPRQASRELQKSLSNQPEASLISETRRGKHRLLEYDFPVQNLTLRYQTLLVYCQNQTYVVAVAGDAQQFDQRAPLFASVLDSARCQEPVQTPRLQSGKLGMTITPALDDPLQGYYPAVRLAKESGVQVSHFPFAWSDLETAPGQYQWNWFDHVMDLHSGEKLEVSLTINVIHTAVRGPMPADLVDLPFDDPVFIQRFTDFILTLLDRYPGQIHYLGIGNEVNDYFAAHRDEIEPYKTFFLSVKEAIAAKHPQVKVAMTFAYHNAENQGALDIIDQLNVGDFAPFTLYIYSGLFQFDRNPQELSGYVDRMLAAAGDKPMAIVELGWSTAENLDGSEAEQVALIRQAFEALPQHRERIEFLAWFNLHDSRPENCRQAALSFIPHRPDLAEDPEFMQQFVDFLCYLGLRHNDGAPKAGWSAWQESADTYLADYASTNSN